jgi:hypothetical protein
MNFDTSFQNDSPIVKMKERKTFDFTKPQPCPVTMEAGLKWTRREVGREGKGVRRDYVRFKGDLSSIQIGHRAALYRTGPVGAPPSSPLPHLDRFVWKRVLCMPAGAVVAWTFVAPHMIFSNNNWRASPASEDQ